MSLILLKLLHAKLVVKSAVPLETFNELFVRKHGWQGKLNKNCVLLITSIYFTFLGADGVYSCKISKNVTIWHFADTFIGDRIENKRTNWTLIRNSAGIQKGTRIYNDFDNDTLH